jgi:hypothetical protein
MADMRRGRSSGPRKIAATLAALVIVTLGVVGWRSGPSAAGSAKRPVAPVAAVDPPPPARSSEPARVAEDRVASPASPTALPSPSNAPSSGGEATTGPPVFDLAGLAHGAPPQPTSDGDRFRTTDRFSADDLAHPERYFEAAARVPELQRDEERRDVLDYFLAYRAQLERDLAAAGSDVGKRTAVLAVIGRYDAAIARLRSSLETPAP